MKLYILVQIGFGIIFQSKNIMDVKSKYDVESCNGKYAGFNIKEIEVIDREYNLNNANDLQYLQLCNNN